MSLSLCQLAILIAKLLHLYVAVLFVYAVISWLPSLRGRWTDYLEMAVEPVLTPVRRLIPPIGGFDISFIVVVALLQIVAGLLVRESCPTYF